MSAPQTAPRDPTARERRIRKRTIKNLRRALREGDEQLSPLWVRIDPDFAFFRRERNADEDWQELVERPAKRLDERQGTPRWTPPTAEREPARLVLPPRAWNPRLRIAFWIFVALAVVYWLVVSDPHRSFYFAGALALAFAARRIVVAVVDLRLTRPSLRERGEGEPPSDNSRPGGSDGGHPGAG